LSLGLVSAGAGELINNICFGIRSLMPIVALTLFIIAAFIFGIGKVMGQEYRSKTESWAIKILVSSIIGLIIAISAPFVIGFLYENMDPYGYMEFTCEEYME
jgi:uncharacterized membrane protein YoaK (UPF0700 family)